LTWSTLTTVVLASEPALPVLLSVLSGSLGGPDSRAVVVPAISPAGGVGVLAQAATSAAHATTARNRPNCMNFSEVTPKKGGPILWKSPVGVNEIFPRSADLPACFGQ